MNNTEGGAKKNLADQVPPPALTLTIGTPDSPRSPRTPGGVATPGTSGALDLAMSPAVPSPFRHGDGNETVATERTAEKTAVAAVAVAAMGGGGTGEAKGSVGGCSDEGSEGSSLAVKVQEDVDLLWSAQGKLLKVRASGKVLIGRQGGGGQARQGVQGTTLRGSLRLTMLGSGGGGPMEAAGFQLKAHPTYLNSVSDGGGAASGCTAYDFSVPAAAAGEGGPGGPGGTGGAVALHYKYTNGDTPHPLEARSQLIKVLCKCILAADGSTVDVSAQAVANPRNGAPLREFTMMVSVPIPPGRTVESELQGGDRSRGWWWMDVDLWCSHLDL